MRRNFTGHGSGSAHLISNTIIWVAFRTSPPSHRPIFNPSLVTYKNRIPAVLTPSTRTYSSTHRHNHKMVDDVEKSLHLVSNGEHPATHQIAESTEGKHEWKARPPYRIHDPNEHFVPRYEANCHCGRVEYQLSREEPLDSKLCHCTTCQTQHGMSFSHPN